MKLIFIFVLFVLLVVGCTYVPASEDKSKWFATLEDGGPGKLIPVSENVGTVCLEIKSKSWVPLIGPDGFGGPREGKEYWVNLVGGGPVYHDPKLVDSSRLQQSDYRGTITVDKKGKKVIIDLQRIISKSDEPEKLEPSLANGTYPIKRWKK